MDKLLSKIESTCSFIHVEDGNERWEKGDLFYLVGLNKKQWEDSITTNDVDAVKTYIEDMDIVEDVVKYGMKMIRYESDGKVAIVRKTIDKSFTSATLFRISHD